MNGRELYELIQQNFHTLGGNWVVDEDGNLRITGYTQPTGLVFDQTLGKITELVVEWDTTCLGAGGYIHSNLSPVFYSDTDFNPESENHNNRFRILVHNCDYTNGGNNLGTLMSIPPETPIGEGNIWANATQPTAQGHITPNTRHTFKFEKRDGYLKFYEDDVLLSSRVDNYATIPLYFGWYFWFGSNNTGYSANFIIHSYTMSGRDTTYGIINRYAGSSALSRVATIVKNYVDNIVSKFVTLNSNQTITGTKTFEPGLLIGNDGNICKSNNTGTIAVSGNTTTAHGGRISMNGSDNTTDPGKVTLTADDGTNTGEITLYSDNSLIPSTTSFTLGTRSNRFAVINGLPSCSLGFPGKRTVDFINVMIAVSGVYDITISADDIPADGYLILTCDPTNFVYCVIDQTDGLTTTTGSSNAYASMGCDVGISMPVIAGKDVHVHCKGTINTCIWRECKDNEHIGPGPNEIWVDASAWYDSQDWPDDPKDPYYNSISAYAGYDWDTDNEINLYENEKEGGRPLTCNTHGYFVWDISDFTLDPANANKPLLLDFVGGTSGYISARGSEKIGDEWVWVYIKLPNNSSDLRDLGGKIIKIYMADPHIDILD